MRNHAAHGLFLAAALLAPCFRSASAQVPTTVDNIRITPANPNVGKLLELSNDTIAAASITLADLLWYEYRVSPDLIRGLTSEQMATRFDVVGRIDPIEQSGPRHYQTSQSLSPLIHALLQNHFRLGAHEAQEDVTSYELRMVPDRPRPTPCPRSSSRAINAAASPLKSRCISMDRLAAQLSKDLQTLVVDKTGLGGTFAIDLNWPSQASASSQSPERLLNETLAKQFGLWLMPLRSQIGVVVIDHVEFPASVILSPPGSDPGQAGQSSSH